MNFSPLTFINAKSKRCILSSCLLRLCNSLFELAPRGFVPESECKSTATFPNYQIFQQLFLNFFQHYHHKIPLLPFSTTTYTNKNIFPLFTRFTKNFTKFRVLCRFLHELFVFLDNRIFLKLLKKKLLRILLRRIL